MYILGMSLKITESKWQPHVPGANDLILWTQNVWIPPDHRDAWIQQAIVLQTKQLTWIFNSSPPGQNGRHFSDNVFRCIFVNGKFCILIKISLKLVLKGPINSIPSLVQMMAWRRPGDKPISQPMMVSSLTHICVTRPQRVINSLRSGEWWHIYVSLNWAIIWTDADILSIRSGDYA